MHTGPATDMTPAWFEGELRRAFPRAEALAVVACEPAGDGAWRVEAEWADTCEYVRREFIFESAGEAMAFREGATRRGKASTA